MIPVVTELPGCLVRDPERNCVLVVGHLAGAVLFGAERSLLDLLDGFAEIGIDVVVAVPLEAEKNNGYLEALMQRSTAVYLEKIPIRRGPDGPDESVILRFCELVMRHGVGAVHCNTVVPREPLLAARRCGIKAVVNAREIPPGNPELCEWMGATAEEIVEAVLSEADYVIANSKATALAFPLSGRVAIVPNVVDVARFDTDRTRSDGTVRDPVNVALVGSVSFSKGVKEFLELARRLDGVVAARFLLIGAVSQEAKQMLADQTEPANLEIVGYVDTPEEAVRQVDILVNMSTVRESFSRSVLEAMASGLPVVAFAEGGHADLIRDGESGYLVEPGNVTEFADRIHLLCLDEELRKHMGREGRRIAETQYNPSVLADCLRTAYRAVLPSPASVAATVDDITLTFPDDNRTDFLTPFFVAHRARFASCTDVAFLDDEHLVAASLLGRRMSLVRFDRQRRTLEVLSETPTIAAGVEASIDLFDVDGDRRIVTADCEQSSVSLYQAGSRDVRPVDTIPVSGFCHGASFVPGSPDLICASVTTGDVGVHFVSISRRRVVRSISEHGWIPKSVAFPGAGTIVVGWVRRNIGEVPRVAHDAKFSLIRLPRWGRRTRYLAEHELPGLSADGCSIHRGRLFVANQVEDSVLEFEVTRRSMRRLPDRPGYSFPHGVAVSPDGQWLAVANYGTNSLVLRPLDAVP